MCCYYSQIILHAELRTAYYFCSLHTVSVNILLSSPTYVTKVYLCSQRFVCKSTFKRDTREEFIAPIFLNNEQFGVLLLHSILFGISKCLQIRCYQSNSDCCILTSYHLCFIRCDEVAKFINNMFNFIDIYFCSCSAVAQSMSFT